MGPEGAKLKASPRKMPERYELWLDAQIYSKQASDSYRNFQETISPLESTRSQVVLDRMWKVIEMVRFKMCHSFESLLWTFDTQNYFWVANVSIDSLWQLEDAHRRTPQWTAVFTPNLAIPNYDSDGEDLTKSLVKSGSRKNGSKQQRKLLAITDGRTDDGYESMPGLQSVSDTSDDGDTDYNDTDEEGDDDDGDDDDDETAYDSEEEELYRNFLREAMDAAMAIPEFFDRKVDVPEFDTMAEERKGNPFLKLLSSLRGNVTRLLQSVS